MNKKDLIRLLEEIALYLEIKAENPFRIAAYRKAAQGLERDLRSLQEIEDFETVDGIGKGTKDVIVEFIETGKSSLLEELKTEIPESLIPLLKLPGLGGKRVSRLYKELEIVDRASLKAACLDGSILSIRGFGQKMVANILQSLAEQEERPDRLPIHEMLILAEKIEQYLSTIEEIETFSVAGSLRRLKEKVRDIDFIIATNEPEKVSKNLLEMEGIQEVLAAGKTKVSFVLEADYPVQVDYRLVPPEAYATSLHHFTGSKEHNVMMRKLAKRRGEKINEYGVTNEETGELLHFESEAAFFQHFDLPYIWPELREKRFELDWFKEGHRLIQEEDIRGDLHMHTTWSDGANSLEEMVRACIEKGYEYIAITDHSKYLQVANGLDESALVAQKEEIDRLNAKYDQIHIFAGVEMDILPNGELDFSDAFLQEMDFVIAAIHSGFNQSEEEIMKRLRHACEHPEVDLIAHPSGRLIGRRPAYAVDLEELIELAAESNTGLELNANPMRFDLSPAWLQVAQEKGVPLSINTDAHQIKHLHFMNYGVRVARKGLIQADSVMNTWSYERILSYLNRSK